VSWRIEGHNRKGPATVEPQLSVPFIGVQAPGTSDYDVAVSLSGIPITAVGFYQSCYTGTAFRTFPQSTFDHYYAIPAIQRVVHSMQLQSTSGDPTNDPMFNCQATLNGIHDSYITAIGNGYKNLDPRVEKIVRYQHEMDGNWYPWGSEGGNNGNTVTLQRDAFRYVHDKLKNIDPTIKMMWCPDSYSTSTNSTILEGCFPGTGYIDYMSLDVYNWGPSSLGAHGWRTPSTMFSQTKTWFATVAPNIPIIVGETGAPFAPAGSFPDNTGDKNAWIASLRTYLDTWPQVIGCMWMQDTNKGGCRINRIAHNTAFKFPNPNSYQADTVGTYSDTSSTAFGTAFSDWV
jgi:hypothetical protein